MKMKVLIMLLSALAVARTSQAATYYVTTTGNDNNTGTSEAQAFRTVTKAVSKGVNTINVKSGTYIESVTTGVYGINFVGYGPTKPIMDGQGTRGAALTSGPMAIQNFEIRNYVTYGISITYGNGSTVIKDCVIHNIGSQTQSMPKGIWLANSNNSKITNNVVYLVGPGSEGMGIHVYTSTNVTVDGNVTYLCRKSGIRDGNGSGCILKNNRSYLNWVGIEINGCINALVVNNYMHNNTIGFYPKHGGGTAQWNCFWHNTIYNSSLASVACGGDSPAINYIDIRDNIYDNAGSSFFDDFTNTATFATVDYNDYFRRPNNYPTYFYVLGWPTHTVTCTTMTAFQAYRTAWEDHGMTFDPQLLDPTSGNLDYPATSPAAAGGVALPDALGKQLGARGLPAAALKWVPITMTAIATNMSGGGGSMGSTCDGRQESYFYGSSPSNQYIVYDFGSVKTLSHVRLESFMHDDTRNVKAYSFQTSQTNNGTDWVTVVTGTNPDASFCTYEYALATPTSARYLKFNMISNFGGASLMLADVAAGNLTANVSSQTLINDPFTDGGRTDGADPYDTAWYLYNTGTLTMVSNTMQISAGTFQGAAGRFTATTLAVGQTLDASFSGRFTTTPTGSMRFGFYNSKGTYLTDGGVQDQDDEGYFGYIDNSAGVSAVFTEVGSSGDSILGGSGQTQLTGTQNATAPAAGTTVHAYRLTMTRTTTTAMLLNVYMDGTLLYTVTHSASIFTTFDEFAMGKVTTSPLEVDNVLVQLY